MFTRNYWKVIAAYWQDKHINVVGDSTKTGKPTLITVSGDVGADVYSDKSYARVPFEMGSSSITKYILNSVSTVDISQNNVDSSSSNSVGSYPRVFFGTGNTAATIDDYKFVGDVVQNITYSYTNNSTYEDDGSSSTISFNYTVTNNNATEITIGEIGIFAEAVWMTAANKYTHHHYMYERTALESPITIPAGGVGQVTYNIRMDYPVT